MIPNFSQDRCIALLPPIELGCHRGLSARVVDLDNT